MTKHLKTFANIADMTALIDYMLSGDGHPFNYINANINQDRRINVADVTELIDMLISDQDPEPEPD